MGEPAWDGDGAVRCASGWYVILLRVFGWGLPTPTLDGRFGKGMNFEFSSLQATQIAYFAGNLNFVAIKLCVIGEFAPFQPV